MDATNHGLHPPRLLDHTQPGMSLAAQTWGTILISCGDDRTTTSPEERPRSVRGLGLFQESSLYYLHTLFIYRLPGSLYGVSLRARTKDHGTHTMDSA